MWNGVLMGVKVQSGLSGSNSGTHQLQNQWRLNHKQLMLKHYFEEWKNLAKDMHTADNCRKNKETQKAKYNQEKRVAYCSYSCIDLNTILLQNERELLRKSWSLWKETLKSNKDLRRVKFKPKGKCPQKQNQVMTQSLNGSHFTIINDLLRDKNHIKKKYFDLWRENSRSHSVSEAIDELECHENYFFNLEKNNTSYTIYPLDTKYTSKENAADGILRDYLNMWRAVKSCPQLVKEYDVPTSKIENFLIAVRAAKMKTAKKLWSNHSTQQSKQRKQNSDPLKLNCQGVGGQAWDKMPSLMENQTPIKTKMRESLDPRDDVNNKTVSSIKKEVSMSLEEAQSLLESTMAASCRGNCTRRKAFKWRKVGSPPLPMEMPAGAIVERMRAREEERARRWERNRERRERVEGERVARALEEERRQHEASQRLRLQERRERRVGRVLRERQLVEIRREYHQLNSIALQHYDGKLLRKGWQSFVNELDAKAALESQASAHHDKVLIQRLLNEWRNITFLICERQISSAVEFHEKMLLRTCLKQFSKLQQEYILNKQTSTDFCEMRIQEKAFLHWNQYTCDMMIQMSLKAEIADMLYMRCLLRNTFHRWRRLPSVMESERARERIRNSFRMKVLEIFPDFCPLQIEDD